MARLCQTRLSGECGRGYQLLLLLSVWIYARYLFGGVLEWKGAGILMCDREG